MIKIKADKGKISARVKIAGDPSNLAELTVAMVALGEAVEQVISRHPEIGQKAKADCTKAFTMAANGSSRAEIAEAITGKKD